MSIRALRLEKNTYFVHYAGSVELDESYFGGRRKSRRGRGAAGKVVVFGILKRNGRVYTIVVDNAKSESLLPVIKKKSCLTVLFIQTA